MKTSPAQALPTGPLTLEVPPLLLSSLGGWLAGWALHLQSAAGDPARVLRAGVELEQLGLEMQALVHALRGTRPAAAEPVDLQSAAAQSLLQWQAALRQAGVRVELLPGPAVVQELEAGLLQHALDLLLGHALAGARDAGLAVVKLVGGVHELRLEGVGPQADEDELHWLLLRLLAKARGWFLHRDPGKAAGTATVALRLGRAVAEPAPGDEEGLPRRRLDLALRVLVLDPHEPSRVLCAQLLRQAGLAHDCLATLDQARDQLAAGDRGWNVLVAGIAAEEPGMAAFVDRLRESQGLRRWIELVDDDDRFDIGVPDASRPARLGRQDLQHTLLQALAA